MVARFDRYRMRDGETPLAERYFNPIWQDIDLRLGGLEGLRIAWEEAVRTLTEFGLARINSALAESMAVIDTATDDAAAIALKRAAADSALAELSAIIASLETSTASDLSAWKALQLADLDTWRASLTAELPGIDARLDALETSQADIATDQAALSADLNTIRALALTGF